VAASSKGPIELQNVVVAQAEFILNSMRERWASASSGSPKNKDVSEVAPLPQRFVDKMLTNYLNVGFIHMIFPNALILHVARNPMDTLFSAYKHDFAPGHLDYMASRFVFSIRRKESYLFPTINKGTGYSVLVVDKPLPLLLLLPGCCSPLLLHAMTTVLVSRSHSTSDRITSSTEAKLIDEGSVRAGGGGSCRSAIACHSTSGGSSSRTEGTFTEEDFGILLRLIFAEFASHM